MPFIEALVDNPGLPHYAGGFAKRPKNACYDTTPFQSGLDYEMDLWASIARRGGMHRVCVKSACQERHDVIPPHLGMPRDGRRFEVTGSGGPPPAGASGVYLNYRVPTGYRGIIQSIVNLYAPAVGSYGPGFGALYWGLEIGGVTAKGYGEIRTQLGSLQDRFSLEGAGFFVNPGDTIKYFCGLDAGSPITGGFITCSVAGYLWPL